MPRSKMVAERSVCENELFIVVNNLVKGSWEDTVRAIKERRKRNETRMSSFRLPVWVVERPNAEGLAFL